MKLIKADKEHFWFQVPKREKQILFKVLDLYPLIPLAHQRLSRSEDRPEAQQMLDEALASQRRENKDQIELVVKSHMHVHGESYKLSLSPATMELLLQVLNDIRVGSWLLLGSPAGPAETIKALNQTTAPYFWSMEMAGGFQQILLRALNGGELEEPDETAKPTEPPQPPS